MFVMNLNYLNKSFLEGNIPEGCRFYWCKHALLMPLVNKIQDGIAGKEN